MQNPLSQDRFRRCGTTLAVGAAAVLLALFLLIGCGGGGGSEAESGEGEEVTHDRDGAIAAVDEGVQALQDLINSEPQEFPYPDVSGIAATFESAHDLDPTYDDAAFWSSLAALFTFLDSDATQAFLAKLGWDDFSLTPEFLDFVDRMGQTIGAGLELFELTSADPESPPLHDLFLPNDPNEGTDPNPCYEFSQGPPCEDASIWTPTQVIFLGTDPWVDVTFAELYAFITESFGGVVRDAVARLKGISPDFSTTITALPFDESEEVPVVLTIDRFEVDLLQAIYGVLDVITALPQIWSFAGVDAFVSQNSTRDQFTGVFMDELTTDELVDFVKFGVDGAPDTGDEPLKSNPTGLNRLRSALTNLLGALERGLARLATGDALAGHLVPVGLLFDSYDDQPAVLAYSAGVLADMAASVGASIGGATTVPVRVPVATIQNFDVCEPVAGQPPDPDPMATTPFWSETDLPTLNSVAGDLGDLSLGGHATVNSAGAFLHSDGFYYFRFTLTDPADVSVYTTSAAGTDVDTEGALAYHAVVGQANVPQPWDGDQDSGVNDHFGLSIAADYMNPGVMSNLFGGGRSAMTFYLQVAHHSGGDFDLHVHVVPDGSPWPATEPVFLKGGGGRNFLARTYELGSARVNFGAALGVLSSFWDLSNRDTLSITDDPQTGDTELSLLFDNSTVAQSIASILPDADLAATGLLAPGTFDVFNDTLDLDPASMGLTINDPPLELQAYGSAAFCALPDDLGAFFQVAGGRLAFPF